MKKKKMLSKILIICAVVVGVLEILAVIFFMVGTGSFFTKPRDITDVPGSISISYTKNGKSREPLSGNDKKPELRWYETMEEALEDDELIRDSVNGKIDYKESDAVELLQIQTNDQLAVFYCRAPEKGEVGRVAYFVLEVQEGRYSQPVKWGAVGNEPGFFTPKGNSFYSYDCDDGVVFYIEQELVFGRLSGLGKDESPVYFGTGEGEIPVCFGMWDDESEIRSLTMAGTAPEVVPVVAKEDTRYFWYFEDIAWADRLSEVNWGDYTYRDVIEMLEIEYEPSE